MDGKDKPRCGYCDKPQEVSGEELSQLWSPEKRMYLPACSSCYARAVASYRKRLLSRIKGS